MRQTRKGISNSHARAVSRFGIVDGDFGEIKNRNRVRGFLVLTTIVVLCCAGFIPTGGAGCLVSGVSTRNHLERTPTVMGLDYYLHLFDMKLYREKVLPAYRAFFENDDANALIALLNEVVHKLDTDTPMPHPDIWDRKTYQEAIGILQGTAFYSPKGEDSAAMKGKKTTRGARRIFVKDNLGYKLVLALCVPRDKGVDPEQNMGRSRLIPYLYERSEWIEELFTSIRQVRGGSLEIPLGESPSQIFSKEDLREFNAELSKVSPPEGDIEIKERELRKQFDNLRKMVRIASDDADLTLILSLL